MQDDSSPAPPPAVNPGHDLGVLFVHGIGQQAQGDTLVRFGEPVQRWLERWLSACADVAHPQWVDVKRATFTSVGGNERTPAQAELAVKGIEAGDEPASSWLFAESWWADAFLLPGFQEIASWGFRTLPWSLSTHFATRTRRTLRAFGQANGLGKAGVGFRLIIDLLSFVLALLLFPLVVSFLMVILVVGALPVPKVREFAARLQQLLARTLGDSFVLIASPFQEAVIVGKVERDIRWLLGQGCRRVAVVAHSQGAAVAHAALKRVLPETTEEAAREIEDDEGGLLFVTVGSGLNKLGEIRHLRGKSNPRNVWFAPAGFLMSALSLPAAIESLQADEMNAYAVTFAVVGIALLVRGIVKAWEEIRPSPDELGFKTQPRVRWIDFYASADPVPNGAMYDAPELTRRVMDSRLVRNGGSVLFDHTTYWANTDEFLGQLCSALCDHAGVAYSRPDSMDASHLAVPRYRRKWRTGWLLVLRYTTLLLTLGVIVLNWEDLSTVARGPWQALAAFLDNIPLVRSFVSVENLDDDISHILGIMVFGTIGFLVYFVLASIWMIWYRSDLVSLFERKRYRGLSGSFVALLLSYVVAIVAFALAMMGYADGIWSGLFAAFAGWMMLFLGAGIVILAILGASFTVFRLLKSLGRLIWKVIFWKNAVPGRLHEHGAQPGDEAAGDTRVIDWLPDRRRTQRVLLSLGVLIVLTFPYTTVIASTMTARELWGDRWFWEYLFEAPEELMTAIEMASSNQAVQLWQWIFGAFLVVAAGNLIAVLGGFAGIRTWFRRMAQAEPTAVVHARHLEGEAATAVLARGARLVMQDIEALVSELRRLAPADSGGKEEPAIRLRRQAREAYEILTAWNASDAQHRAWLLQLGRVMPAAAITWSHRFGREEPAQAASLLSMHLDQPRWRVRRRVRSAFRLIETARAQQVGMAG